MPYTPEEYTPIRNKSEIRWLQDGEDGNQEVLNRPIDDLANMVQTVANDSKAKASVRLCHDGNLQYNSKTTTTLVGLDGAGTFVCDIIDTSTVVTLKAPYTTNSLIIGASITGGGLDTDTVISDITSSTEIIISKPATSTVVDSTISYTQTVTLLYIDGIRPNNNDRILLKDQTLLPENGIYVVTDKGSDITPWVLTRSEDANDWDVLASCIVATDEGLSNADTVWFCTINKGAGVIGTNNIEFTSLGGSGQMLGKARVRVFSYNAKTVTENIVVPGNVNASTIGPVTINDGYSVTIEDGARLLVL